MHDPECEKSTSALRFLWLSFPVFSPTDFPDLSMMLAKRSVERKLMRVGAVVHVFYLSEA